MLSEKLMLRFQNKELADSPKLGFYHSILLVLAGYKQMVKHALDEVSY